MEDGIHYIRIVCISMRGGLPLLLVSPSLGKNTLSLSPTEQQRSPLIYIDSQIHINLRTACTDYEALLTLHNHLHTYVRMQRKWIQWVTNHRGPLERTLPSPSSPDPSGRLQGTSPAQQHILSYVQQTSICDYI